VINEQWILDYRVVLGITDRWSIGASVPYLEGSWSLPLPFLPAGPRREQDAKGFGDILVTPRVWLLDPKSHPRGNVQVGLGLKVPTGEENAKDRFPDFSGSNVANRPVDVSIQPGDGGWGAAFDLNAFRDVGRARLFLGGTYLFNPRETNRTHSTASALLGAANVDERIRFNSVADQYLAQAGVAFGLGRGFGASVAWRWEGVPPRDRFGGNDGFRRPGYTVSVAPGLSYTAGSTTFSLSVPITTQRNRQEDAEGMAGDATFARWSILAGVTIRF
jgi:hypothetical protein